MIKYIYVASPMSKGDQFVNVRQAVHVGERLRACGFIPFLPQLTVFWHFLTPNDYETWMDYDFSWIDRCDALLRMPGESPGADREVAYAIGRGIPVYYNEFDLLETARVSPLPKAI